MAASESRDLVVMETGLKITTNSVINIPWKFKWLLFKSLEDIVFPRNFEFSQTSTSVSTQFRVLPNFHECFYNVWEHGGKCFLFLL